MAAESASIEIPRLCRITNMPDPPLPESGEPSVRVFDIVDPTSANEGFEALNQDVVQG